MRSRSDFIGRIAFAILAVAGLAVATVGAAPMKRYTAHLNSHKGTDENSWVSERAVLIQGYALLSSSTSTPTGFIAKTRAQVVTSLTNYLNGNSSRLALARDGVANRSDVIVMPDIEYPKVFAPNNMNKFFEEDGSGGYQFVSSLTWTGGGTTYTWPSTATPETPAELFEKMRNAYEVRIKATKDVLDPGWDAPGASYEGPRIALFGLPNPTNHTNPDTLPNRLRRHAWAQLAASRTPDSSNPNTAGMLSPNASGSSYGALDELDFVSPQCYFVISPEDETYSVEISPGVFEDIYENVTRAQNSIDFAQELKYSSGHRVTAKQSDYIPVFPLLRQQQPVSDGSGGTDHVGADADVMQDAIDVIRAEGIEEYGFWGWHTAMDAAGISDPQDIFEWYDQFYATGDIDGDGDNDCDDYDDFTAGWTKIDLGTHTAPWMLDYNDDGVTDNDDKHAFYNEWDPADVTTTSTNPGDALYGIADGDVSTADLSYFTIIQIAGDSAADLTTSGTNPGDANYGVPDGTVDSADLSYYVEIWTNHRAACP
ncbi:MAG: GC-type dockerin domain-anchored protein [Planctomycetota bacterium]